MRLMLVAASISVALTASARAATCQGPLPHAHQTFSGRARLVHDGDTLCIGPGADRRTWVAVRVADFYAPELYEPGGPQARAALQSIVGRRWVVCTAQHRSYARIVARCTVGGASLGDLMRRAGVAEGGRGWRP